MEEGGENPECRREWGGSPNPGGRLPFLHKMYRSATTPQQHRALGLQGASPNGAGAGRAHGEPQRHPAPRGAANATPCTPKSMVPTSQDGSEGTFTPIPGR